MTPKRRENRKERSARIAELQREQPKSIGSVQPRYIAVIGAAIVLLCTVGIYGRPSEFPPSIMKTRSTWSGVPTLM